MYVAKVIGCLLILSGSSGLGIWYGMQLQRRTFHIKEMMRILDIVRSEIQYSRSTLPECCEKVSEKTSPPYKELFQNICRQLRMEYGIGFDRISVQIMGQGLEKLPLKEERNIFIRCFSDVGYGDSQMQYQIVERGRKELQDILEREEEDLKKRSKLAVSLGTMSGILLILILV